MLHRYFLLFIMYSFLGWFMEVLVSFRNKHHFVNRGFLIGPICPIYGYGCVLMTILLSKYKDDFIVFFVMAIALFSVLEYFTSFFMEKVFHARWWDYSNKKFNLNGRICLETMLPFGILGSVVMYIINPTFMYILDLIPYHISKLIALAVFVVLILDTVVSFEIIGNMRYLSNNIKKDSTEEITKKVKEILIEKNFFTKRLMEAFPDLEILKRKTKEKIEKTKAEIRAKRRELRRIEREVRKEEKKLRKLGKNKK